MSTQEHNSAHPWRRLSGLVGLIGLCGVAAGCPGTLENPDRFQPIATSCALQIDVEADLLAARCGTTNCHVAGPSASAGLDLASANPMARLKDLPELSCTQRPLVSSANPRASVLLDRLKGTPSCGARMPLIGDPFTQQEIDCVEVWINQTLTGTNSSALEAAR